MHAQIVASMGSRILKLHNGECTLIRPTAAAIKYMDNNFVGYKGRWVQKGHTGETFFTEMAGYTKGFIIGKGPSIHNARPEPNCPVIFINHAIEMCLTRFTDLTPSLTWFLAMDRDVFPTKSDKYRKIVHSQISYQHPGAVVFHPYMLGTPPGSPSVIMAITLMKRIGIQELEMAGFDSFTDGNITYADTKIPKNPKLVTQRPKIRRALDGIPKVSFRTVHGMMSYPFTS